MLSIEFGYYVEFLSEDPRWLLGELNSSGEIFEPVSTDSRTLKGYVSCANVKELVSNYYKKAFPMAVIATVSEAINREEGTYESPSIFLKEALESTFP